MFLSGRKNPELESVNQLPLTRLFFDGIIVSVLNPKIAIFFLAFLPHFVNLRIGEPSLQILILGLIYAGLAFITDSAYGLMAGSLKNWLNNKVMQSSFPQYVSGTILIGLGLKTALDASRS